MFFVGELLMLLPLVVVELLLLWLDIDLLLYLYPCLILDCFVKLIMLTRTMSASIMLPIYY